ncbi:hypothetical protein ACTHQ4_10405 [Alkalicoccobacillus gibsonii]
MEQIIKKAEELKVLIKNNEREIDNPALTRSVISELDFFIENVGDEE